MTSLLDGTLRVAYAIGLIAVVLRLGVAAYMGDQVQLARDEQSYNELGKRLAQGFGYTFAEPWYPGFVASDVPTAHWSFLFAAWVASIYAVAGVHPLAARIVGATVGGVLLPWLLFRLGRRVWPEREALAVLSAGLGAIYAYFVLYAAMIMTETFFICAVLWSLERALALLDLYSDGNRSRRRYLVVALGLGVSLGLATLLRQSILPWAVVLFGLLLLAGWRLERSRQALAALLVTGAIIVAFILPFTIRNYIVYGDFLMLNSNAGYAMYSAQHPMHGTSFQAFAAAPLPDDLEPRPENEAQWDRALLRRGLEFIVAEPGRYALLSLSRMADYFMFWPAEETILINNIGRVLSFGLFLPFILYGLWLSRREWRRYWLLYAFMLFYSAMHILTWAMIRYRLPVDAVLLLFAALALVELARRFRVQQWLPRRVDNDAAETA